MISIKDRIGFGKVRMWNVGQLNLGMCRDYEGCSLSFKDKY